MTPGLPVPLTESDIRVLADYLDNELEEGLRLHVEREDRLTKWQKAYDGEPASPKKDFPWPGACNVVIPLIGIAVDSIVARIVNTLFSVEPFWTVRPLRPEMERFAKPVESFLEWSRQSEYNMYREVRRWAPEVVKFGWGYLKVPWDMHTIREFSHGEAGPELMESLIRRPNPHHVLLRDVIPQAGVEDELEQAEWLAQRFYLTDGQLRARQAEGIFHNVDRVIAFKQGATTGEGVREKLSRIYEVWCNVALPGQFLADSFVATFHKDTKTILRVIYNPYFNLKRPFVKAKFIEQEGRLEGMGIAKRLFDMQHEITTIHCQQVDNATIANTRFFIGRRGVVRPRTRVYPGRFLTVPDPERDIKTVQLGDVYNSMHTLSVEILAFSERASGVSDPSLGRESSVVGTRATATGTLAILQEGNRRFDLNVRDIRDSLSEVGRLVLELNHQHRPEGFAFFVQGPDGQLTEQVLRLPKEFLASRMAVELTASTATINRDIERQGLMTLLGTLVQYYERTLQIGTLIVNPQVPVELKQMAATMAEGGRRVMERLVQTFNVKDIDAVLPPIFALGGDNGAADSAGVPVPGSENGALAGV